MQSVEVQQVLQFLSLLYGLTQRLSAKMLREALEGPIELEEIALTVPWAFVEAVIRYNPRLVADPARHVWWDLRNADPLNRIHLTKALVDASDNQTLGAVHLLAPELRARPELVQILLGSADAIADTLADPALTPKGKIDALQEMLASL
jgi:hypothetical protein